MKILFALNAGNPGGVEQHVLDLTKGLIQRGHKVYVWCQNGPIVEWYKSVGANVTTQKIRFEIDLLYILKLKNFIKKEGIDVVHGHELKAGVNAVIAATLGGAKAKVTHIHTPMSEWQQPNYFKKLLTFFEIKFYEVFVNIFSDVEIALTESRKKIKQKEGILSGQLTVIPNGVEIEKFQFNDNKLEYRDEILARYSIPFDARVVGHVGRMTEEKGHEVLIEGFSKLPKMHNTYLLLAGGGKLLDSLKEKCKALGIESKVIFSGIFDREELPKFYASFDVFVFPSLAEGFGLVMLEAMASSLPVISSDLEVLKEVGGKDVVFFKTGDSSDLAQKIKFLLDASDDKRVELGQKLHQRAAEKYSMKTFVENYIKLYKNLLS